MSPANVLEPTYRRLKSALIDGTWAMGAKLEALRLADEYGVSMTPVRDSLNQLVGEGLVDFTPGEGFRVAVMSEQDLRDILSVSLLLLMGAIEGAWSRPETERDAEPDRYHERIDEILAILAAGSGNRFLLRQIERINERVAVFRQQEPLVLSDAMDHLSRLRLSLDGSRGDRHDAVLHYHRDCLNSIAQLTIRAAR